MTTPNRETLVAASESHGGNSRSPDCPADRHGTRTARHRHGCTCPASLRDARHYQETRRAWVARHGPIIRPAHGATRRLQALACQDWGLEQLAAATGVHSGVLGALRDGRQHRAHIRVLTAIDTAYRNLSDHRGPSVRSGTWARKHGWLAPIWWDDDTIDDPAYHPPLHDVTSKDDLDPVNVDRACDGERVTLTRAERLAAVQRLRQRDHSYDEIAARLHVAQRHVHRDLTDLGLTHQEEATA